MKFCFQYFSNTSPNYIVYDLLPKNNLILTHILTEKPEELDLFKYSTLLNVSLSPLIFQGFLTQQQKDKIYEYLQLPPEDILNRFKTESFTKYIIGLLNPEIRKTLLNDDLEKPIDSIIFIFRNQGQDIYAKIIDPIIQELVSTNHAKKENTDMLSIIYSDVIDFMEIQIHKVSKKLLRKSQYEDRYLELMSGLFVKFLNFYPNRYIGIESSLPEFLNKP